MEIHSLYLVRLLYNYLLYATFTFPGLTAAVENIAFNKPAYQSSTHTPSSTPLTADRAVDGIPQICDDAFYSNVTEDEGFSHTDSENWQWWSVDLLQQYYVYRITLCNRGILNERLSNIFILSTNVNDPEDPNRYTTSQWEEQSYQSKAYGNHDDAQLNSSYFLARHVAVYKYDQLGLALREVQINGFTQQDINNVTLTVNKNATLAAVNMAFQVSGFNQDAFENATLNVSKIESPQAPASGDFRTWSVQSDATFQHTDSEVQSSRLHYYEVSLESHGFLLHTQVFFAERYPENCTAPDNLVLESNVQQFADFSDSVQTYITAVVQWQTPGTGCEIHEEPLNYSVSINGSNFTQLSTYTSNGIMYSASLYKLLPYSLYEITIRVSNKQQQYTDSSFPLETIQTAPNDAPGGLALHGFNTSCVTVSWDTSPSRPNGEITSYSVDCGDSSGPKTVNKTYPGSASSLKDEICGFKSGSRIVCSVWAQTTTPAVSVSVNTTTKFDFGKITLSSNSPAIGKSGFYEVMLPQINTSEIQGTVQGYNVIISSTATKRRRRAINCDFDRTRAGPTTFDPLLTYEDSVTCGLDYYLAAKLDEQVQPGYVFPVGDGKVYNGIVNAELEEGVAYSVYYGVDVTLAGETLVVVQFLEESIGSFTVNPVTKSPATVHPTQKAAPPKGGKTITIIVAAVVSSLIAAIIAAIVVVLLVRNRKITKKKELSAIELTRGENEYTNPTAPSVSARPRSTFVPTTESNGVKKQKNKKYRNIKGDYENCPTLPSPTLYGESEAIPVDKLMWYIESNKELILKQYEKLSDVAVGESLAAHLPENKSKCRYKDLYPVDEFRVLLGRLPSQGTNFINASYISGYEKENKFIAAQGPTHATIEDFWLMIWQQQITSVVMATKAFETNKMKCLQYWPIAEKESQTIGEFRITNMGVEKWPDYAITRLKVIKGADEKWLTHFQFLSWPDHDVPDTSQPFLSFYRKFSRRVDVNSGPILVHCSAGVGRSGAIIALDYLFEQARAESRVDFFKCVVKMRERRPNMIQTQEQYLFVHNALYDLLSTEGFLTLTDMLITKKDDKKALSKEYEYIESTLSKVPTITDSGQLPENLPLNRYKHILPDDKFRIYLSGRDNQTYINAIRVNGYHKVDQFYATQIPLEQTIKDLWQLVHERSCKVIVQLGDSPDSTEYYPTTVGTGYSYSSGVHTVTAKSYTERGPLQLFQLEHALEKRNLLKEPRIYSETSEITLIKLPQNLCYKTNIQPMHMISVVEQLVRLTEKMGDINVLVVSSDGAGLCGAFICAFNCLESIRLTQEVEVYNQVLMAKYRRRQFISTFEEYSHIYHILSAYVDQFSQYQNVSCM